MKLRVSTDTSIYIISSMILFQFAGILLLNSPYKISILQESECSEEGIEGALEFLRVAKKDFEASKLLMKHDLYPQALFMIQQSLEKIAKAILLAFGLASIEDLKREVGHKVFTRGMHA